MAASREGPNPLRPYYVPPSVSASPDLGQYGAGVKDVGNNVSASTASLGSSARNILSDMDYSEYLSDSSPRSSEMVKRLVEQALWKYTSVFLSQPFDVAKMMLQVQVLSKQRSTVKGSISSEDSIRRPVTISQDHYEVHCDILNLLDLAD